MKLNFIDPITVANFIYLAKKDFYKDIAFHRVVENYVIQGGDPEGKGSFGGPGYTVPPEISTTEHKRGTIGMARLPGERNPERHSNGSQFYITLTRAPQLDGLYTVFAEVISGFEVLDQIKVGDTIKGIRLPKMPGEKDQ